MPSAPILVPTPSGSSQQQHQRQRSRSTNDATSQQPAAEGETEEEAAASSLPNAVASPPRFNQENYECSFCSTEATTFADLLGHIKCEHPWYDLTVHENIK